MKIFKLCKKELIGGMTMRITKLLSFVTIAVLLGMQSVPVWAQEEEEEELQAKDTPYFSGMPGYNITWNEDRKFDEYNFYNGKDCTTIEGKKMNRGYTFDGDEPASELQIARNYSNAIKNMGGTIIFDGVCEGADCAENCGGRMVVGKVVKAGNELWVEVAPFNGGGDYYLTVVVKESMTQDVTASSMFDALNKQGHVALYINFDTGKATIRPDSKPIIDQIVQMLKANPDLALSVEGHTDNVGDPKSNQTLSENRAKAVAAELIAQDIDTKRLSTIGHGQDMPITDNKTEEGRAQNRRVELVKK
jgi:OOP family OmpA-OmpF porin